MWLMPQGSLKLLGHSDQASRLQSLEVGQVLPCLLLFPSKTQGSGERGTDTKGGLQSWVAFQDWIPGSSFPVMAALGCTEDMQSVGRGLWFH